MRDEHVPVVSFVFGCAPPETIAGLHDAAAPAAYPEIHHLTSPLRAAARARGDADAFNLWAGEAHELAVERPAGETVRQLGADARRIAAEVAERLGAR